MSGEYIVCQMDRIPDAGSIDRHGGSCNPAACDGIVADLGADPGPKVPSSSYVLGRID
jgi:hypothetical protein